MNLKKNSEFTFKCRAVLGRMNSPFGIVKLVNVTLERSGTFDWKAYIVASQYVSMNNNSSQLTHRPKGVTILAVLFVIGGAVALLAGIGTFAAIPFATNLMQDSVNDGALNSSPLSASDQSALIRGTGPILTVIGAVLIPVGIATLIVATGLFRAKGWAWSAAIILSAIGFAMNVISIVTGNMNAITGAVIGMAINAIVLYYLSRRNVRQYFGKVSSTFPTTTTGT